MSYGERANLDCPPVAKKIFSIAEQKKSNLVLAADFTTTEELIACADAVGPYISVLKTHIDIVNDYTQETVKQLQKLAQKHRFLIFEDRKFADIGNTVAGQYEEGIYRINSWAHLINAYAIAGPGIIEALQRGSRVHQNGLLLIAELSSKDNLIDTLFTKRTVELALRYPQFVVGFIAQHRLTGDPTHIYMTPGVQMDAEGDMLGQRYFSPYNAIVERGTDFIIVGRGITQHPNWQEAAKIYQNAGWEAHQAAACRS